MPSYFYHLKFELYPRANPDACPEAEATPREREKKLESKLIQGLDRSRVKGGSKPQGKKEKESKRDERKNEEKKKQKQKDNNNKLTWTPHPGADIFGPAWTGIRDGVTTHIQDPAGLPGAEEDRTAAPPDLSRDWRFAPISIEAIDMPPPDAARVTKAEFRALRTGGTDVGWGVVRLYRDGEESDETAQRVDGVAEGGGDAQEREGKPDYTTLCIPAVPSYLTPSDFLGFVGEGTRAAVSHFRMVMTGRMNRYLVLMKFRDGEVARRWRVQWDGRVFNSVEPETCHVMFIKSITFQTPTSHPDASFPELSHDPFTPSASTASFMKPFPPPTPNLVELPTCPVCLERMDDTTGLLTIPCQHVFHCDCLQKWRGTGCPVCRHTNPPSSSGSSDPPFGSGNASLCTVCDCTDDLWICLICGNVGCGRYKGGHAKEHWKHSSHNFALEIETQHVWDYAGDLWVHRLIRDKGDSKVIELPSSSRAGLGPGRGEDMVPREKLDSIGIEYTHLLTSQLESQRVYFEELVNKAVAKASSASAAAASASSRADDALARLDALTLEHTRLRDDVVAGLEKDLARERKKGERSAEVARGFGQSLVEEKKVSEGLLRRVEHVNLSVEATGRELVAAKAENQELREENRDLMFALQAGDRLRGLEATGEGGEGEVEGGTVVVPERREERRRRGRGK